MKTSIELLLVQLISFLPPNELANVLGGFKKWCGKLQLKESHHQRHFFFHDGKFLSIYILGSTPIDDPCQLVNGFPRPLCHQTSNRKRQMVTKIVVEVMWFKLKLIFFVEWIVQGCIKPYRCLNGFLSV